MLLINMPWPLAGIVLGHATRMGITSATLRSAGGQFAQSLPFGAGYSFGTYVGFPKNYQSQGRYSNKGQTFTIDENKMPYRQNYRKSYGSKKWFSFRKTSWYWKPVYSRKYGKTVYTHPNRRSRYA